MKSSALIVGSLFVGILAALIAAFFAGAWGGLAILLVATVWLLFLPPRPTR